VIKDPQTNQIHSLIVHNQLRTFEINDPLSYNYYIHILIDPILCLPRAEKKEVFSNLLKFVGKNFSYTSGLNLNRLSQVFSNTKHLTGFNFFIHLIGLKIFKSLRQLFQYESDLEMKKFMIMEVDKICGSFTDSQAGGYQTLTLDHFISVKYDDYLKDVVEIGDILLSLDKRNEFCSIYQVFMDEFEESFSPEHKKDTYYQLKMKYRGSHITYQAKLNQMLNQLGFDDSDLMEWISKLEIDLSLINNI
jgi:hypothetical protein